jgi:enoyl-[acyl-carrier-protein] reductase (NADH)
LKRVSTADDVAAMAAFLLSPDAAAITGQILQVDNGMSAVR